MSEDCEHRWVSNSGCGGRPIFRRNRQMSSMPLMHAQCWVCECRTWFTEAQWAELPYTTEEYEL